MRHLLSILFVICIFCYSLGKTYAQESLIISNIKTSSGKVYEISSLAKDKHQYMDRDYQFNYIPEELKDCQHIKTCGNDKLISEDDICLSFNCNCDVDVFILFADKFPSLPNWLNEYERTRLNVTRMDSDPNNLKGYFGMYRKSFAKGKIELKGCSPNSMLAKEGFKESMGSGYCMYTIVVNQKNKD